jgi:7-cyano-7-deazaguanine synthase
MTKALVILSGGQDSTTCAAIACQQFSEVHAVTFDYGQRHAIELESAQSVSAALGIKHHEFIKVGPILASTSPLVSSNALGQYDSPDDLPGGVEPTFIPGRNLLFMTLAANRAAAWGIRDIFTGLCEEDFGGYFDCRQVFVDAMAAALGEGIWGEPDAFTIHTPLMKLSKAASVRLAVEVLGDLFHEVFQHTHTCYAGVKGGCGKCHACHLRDRGFRDAGVDDPIWQHRAVAV